MKHTPEQRESWRLLRQIKPKWRPFYGWRLVPVLRDKEVIGYRRHFSHQPGVILAGPPAGTKIDGKCYIVWGDQSLRKITRQVFESLAKVPAVARVPMLKEAV